MASSISTSPSTASPPNGYAIKSFTVATDNYGNTIEVRITEPNLSAEGLPLETWASSHILASLLRNIKILFPTNSNDKDIDVLPVLELGAGTGLVGISAEAIWRQPVILTDLEPIIPGIQLNVDLNSATRALNGDNYGGEKIRCGTLDWKSPSILSMNTDKRIYFSSNSKAHVILAADTVYSDEHPGLLADVIKNWLYKDLESRVLIAYPMRVAYLDEIRDLWNRFDEAGLEAVKEGKETANGTLFDDELLIEWSVWKWKDEVLSKR